uniref:DUF4283 domain-containing protein n=1 Tax=Fagus sylvatica TaxID=28930 RepID=A0A2N9GB22_FAGSY
MSDFDVLGTVGKLALPIFARFRIRGKSELGLVRYGPASRVHRGVFGPFEGSFPIRIPADPDKFLAIREFHVVHGCVLLSNVPGLADQLVASQEDSVRKRGNVGGKIPEISAQTLFRRPVFTRVVDVAPDVGFRRSWYRRKACATYFSTVQALHRGELGFARYDLANRRPSEWVVSSIQFLVWSTVRSNLGQTWSTLVKLGQNSPNPGKCIPDYISKGFWARWTLVGLGNRLGQTSVKLRSTLVKLGQTLGNVSRTFFLGVFDADEPSSDQADLVRAVLVLRADTRENPGAPNCLFASRPIFSKPWNTHLDSGRTGTQTETNCATAVGERGNRENPSGQKSSHLFFVQRSLCQETPNKEGATVITPFLPPGFSRVSARKTRQPEPSRPVPTRAHHLKYSQKEGPRHISQAVSNPTRTHRAQKPLKCSPGYISKSLESFDQVRPSLFDQAPLEGNVCAKILSDPLQLGPRAKTLRQEDSLQLPHATFGSSRVPPVTQAFRRYQDRRNPTSGATSTTRVKTGRQNKVLLKVPGFPHRRCHACAQSLPDSQQVDLRARAHWKEDTSMHDVELSDRQDFIGASRNPDRKTALKRTKNTPRKLSDGTKNVKIRHRELGQICARTGTRFEKKRAGSKTHFFSRTAAFARRVFPTRNKLIREGCVGKMMTPATTWNSRFADSIPRLTGICIGRVHKNSSDTPTSGSHNSLVRTPIRANFISLERGRRELSDDMPHDPF